MKINEKVISITVSALLVAGATTYALTSGGNAPSVSSEAISSAAETSSAIVSSAKEESITETSSAQTSTSTPSSTLASSPAASAAIIQAESSKSTVSLTPNVSYFDVLDPNTNEFVSPLNPKYESIKAQYGGDAGTVPYDQSAAQKSTIEKFKAQGYVVGDGLIPINSVPSPTNPGTAPNTPTTP